MPEISSKRLQSELGAVGEAYPNFPIVDAVGVKLQDFQHVHGTETNNDSYLFITRIKFGHKYNEENAPVLATNGTAHGCEDDLITMVLNFFAQAPEFYNIFAMACNTFANEMLEGGEDGI